MIKTDYSETIHELLMEDEILNLNIWGVLENEPEAEIYVDHGSCPTGIAVKQGYFNYIYTKSQDFIHRIKLDLFKEGYHGFSGVKETIVEILKKNRQLEWENKVYLLYMPIGNFKTIEKKSYLKDIDIKDAEVIDKFYTYRHEGSLDRIKKDILNRPSSAVYIDGEIRAWVLVHEDNSMGIMYTKEAYRKQGYAYELSLDLSSKLIQQGKIPYIHIVRDNVESLALAKKCGFKIYDEVTWFGIST